MPRPADYDRCVFINCPFDPDYDATLQAILFAVTYLGFVPRIARERMDSGESRLEKIIGLIESSRYSIHDLSRIKAAKAGEFYRLNMPFELGIDFGCRLHMAERGDKRILVLGGDAHEYKAALSDLAGCDIEFHKDNFETAVRHVRGWLVNEAGAVNHRPSTILRKYVDFQDYYYREELAAGATDEDIKAYPTKEVMAAMQKWVADGEPT